MNDVNISVVDARDIQILLKWQHQQIAATGPLSSLVSSLTVDVRLPVWSWNLCPSLIPVFSAEPFLYVWFIVESCQW